MTVAELIKALESVEVKVYAGAGTQSVSSVQHAMTDDGGFLLIDGYPSAADSGLFRKINYAVVISKK